MGMIRFACVLFLIFVAYGTAATTTFTDRNEWEAVTQGRTLVTFNGIAAPGQSVLFDTPEGLTLGGIKFVGEVSRSICDPEGEQCSNDDFNELAVRNPGTGSEGFLFGPSSEFNRGGGQLGTLAGILPRLVLGQPCPASPNTTP